MVVGLVGVGLFVGLVVCNKGLDKDVFVVVVLVDGKLGVVGGVDYSKYEVLFGQLDMYYVFFSGGYLGEVCIYGLFLGCCFKCIFVFNIDCLVGWGIINELKKIMGINLDGMFKYWIGDIYYVYLFYIDGMYDGKYIFVNDKIYSWFVWVCMDMMECDKIVELLNVQGFYGVFLDKWDLVDDKINYIICVFCGNEFYILQFNDGCDLNDLKKYFCLFICVDVEMMELCWQVKVDGNMDLVVMLYDGKFVVFNQYNIEGGVYYEEMMFVECDVCVFFNVVWIEVVVKVGKIFIIGILKVFVVDGIKVVNMDLKIVLICYVFVFKNLYGVNVSLDGKYYVCLGKLLLMVILIEYDFVLKWFNGELKELCDCVVVEFEIGFGLLYIGFDNCGNVYIMLFFDSQIVKWNFEVVIKVFKGDKIVVLVVDCIDVNYQLGYGFILMGEIKELDGKFFILDNKFLKDCFLLVGLLYLEIVQFIDIFGDKMKFVVDYVVYFELYDLIVICCDIIKMCQVYNIDEFLYVVKDLKECWVECKGKQVMVYLILQVFVFGLCEFIVKKGDEVMIIFINFDKVEDLIYGFVILKYNINFIVNLQEIKLVIFKVDKFGVYWCYCINFCYVLYLEMCLCMFVEV